MNQSNHQLYNNSNQFYNTFKTNSFHQSSIQSSQQLHSQSPCHFCYLKPVIMQQLATLRTTILQKNDKIKQLQDLVSKISMLMFKSTQQQVNMQQNSFGNSQQQEYVQELTFSQNIRLDSIESNDRFNLKKFQRRQMEDQGSNNENSQSVTLQKKIIKNSIKDMKINDSQVDKQNVSQRQSLYKPQGLALRQSIQNQIASAQSNREYKNLFNQQMNQLKENLSTKQSPLRSKLLQIINILPSKSSNNVQEYFKTQSEPLDEGRVGLINSKVSNHKVVKHSGFIKKSEKLSEDDKKINLQNSLLQIKKMK